VTIKTSMGGGNLLVLSGSLHSLSPAFQKGGLQVWVRWGVWSGLGAPWASGARGSRAGDPRAAAVFPQLTPALEFADLGADYSADAEGTNVDRPRSSGFQDQACMGLFGPLAPVVPCWGTMGGRCVSMVCL
jgi:hypothetical protein